MGTRINFFKHFVFWVLGSIYSWSVYRKFYYPSDSFINQYLADLLCMPIVFYISTTVIRTLKKDRLFKLTFAQILFGLIYFSVLFELILPAVNDRYTGDWLDVLMYSVGSAFFLLIRNLSERKI